MCFSMLTCPPAIHGLTDSLLSLGDESWKLCVTRLAEAGVVRVAADKGEMTCVAHPLVKEYFEKQTRSDVPDAWHKARCRINDWMGGSIDGLASAIHQSYVQNRGGSVIWNDLSVEIQNANRRCAVSLLENLRSIGITESHDHSSSNRTTLTLEEIEYLAKMEHERWVQDRILSGWIYGPHTDRTNKVSSALVPWDQLSAESKTTEKGMIRSLPEFLTLAGIRVSREAERKDFSDRAF
jgi:hypothetical protein